MKVFVTGGTGLVGSNVIRVAQRKYDAEVIASIYRRVPEATANYKMERVDVTDEVAIMSVLRRHRPQLIVHCAATVDTEALEQNHQQGWRLMVDSVKNIAKAAGEIGAKLILVSSDWVFDGAHGPFSEFTPPCPVCYYGLLKVIGETIVSTIGIEYAIARIAAVYGRNWSFPNWAPHEEVQGFGTLPNWYVMALNRDEEIAVWSKYVNLAANPTLASDCADAMMMIWNKKEEGTFHCCGRECMSRIELARRVAKAFGFSQERVREAREEEMSPTIDSHTLPPITCLEVKRTEETLGRTNVGFDEGLEIWKEQISERVV